MNRSADSTIDVDRFQQRLGVDVPHLDQYSGLWSILEGPFRASVARINGLDPQSYAGTSAMAGVPVGRRGNTAVVCITGPMTKYGSCLSVGTSTIQTRRQIRAAAGDPDIREILLLVDSPGGTVAGTAELAEDVAAAARQKPVTAYIEDLGASAAYWVASQATTVYSNATALVGSIGTYGVIIDASARAEKLGLRVHVLRSGKFKGAGVPGTQVDEEQLAYWQSVVDAINQHVLDAVAAGRRLSPPVVRSLADGRIHVGQAAADLRLIDGIKSLDEVFQSISVPKKPRPTASTISPASSLPPISKGKTMPQYDGGPVAEFNRRVRKRTESGTPRHKAVAAVAREDPELHQAYLLATNAGKGSQVRDSINGRAEMVQQGR